MRAFLLMFFVGTGLCFVAFFPGWQLIAFAGIALMLPLLMVAASSLGDSISEGNQK